MPVLVRLSHAFLGVSLALMGCEAVPTGQNLHELAVLDGAITVAAPKGYCIDKDASVSRGAATVLLIGRCNDQGQVAAAVVTLTIGGPASAGVLAAGPQALGEYFASNAGRKVLARDDRTRLFSLGNMLWHSDSSFKATPAQYSMLHARVIPPEGGETEFADMRAAYDALPEGTKRRIAGLVALDFDWNITKRLTLTQDTNAVAETGGSAIAIIDSRNTTLDLITGLNATINSSLSARFSYAVEYDSNPPPGAVQTDTLSRVTLIYDF